MEPETIDRVPPPLPPRRPTFLTVLCILTFVVSGYTVLNGVFAIAFGDGFSGGDWSVFNEQMQDAMRDADPESQAFLRQFFEAAAETVDAAFRHAVTLGIVDILVGLLSVFAAVLMWRLRRSGYFLYVVVKVLAIVIPLFLLGINILTLSIYGFALFISLIMFVLYGLNLKHMR